MTSTKWKRSSQQWFIKVTIAVWEIDYEQWEHRNAIIRNEHHPWK